MTNRLARRVLFLTICLFIAATGVARAQSVPAENQAPRRDVLVTPQARTQPEPQLARTRFRFTLNGFHVNQETNDDVLERDGPGDEVLGSIVGFMTDNAGNVTAQSFGVSSTPIRNLRTNADHPHAAPQNRAGLPVGGLNIPTTYFVRELTSGQDAVVIVPALFEWDGADDNELVRLFQSDFDAAVPELARAVGSIIRSPTYEQFRQPSLDRFRRFAAVRPGPFGIGPKTRPIGMVKVGDELVYRPEILVFSFGAAVEASRTDYGYGVGIVPVTYVEDSSLRGSYTLYIQVEAVR